jgi:hypothetical protein
MFITFGASLRIYFQMFTDAGKTKNVFIISTHPWFFKNIVADRAMKIFVDIFLKPAIFVAIFLFRLGTSHYLRLTKLCSAYIVEIDILMIFLGKVYLTLWSKYIETKRQTRFWNISAFAMVWFWYFAITKPWLCTKYLEIQITWSKVMTSLHFTSIH